ncbi:MAG: MBL fold metallo-hydrolase [Chitinispirillaceae bacterium]|nr:MBL fold metallo-hydrolase [Chitinispirillaceae bacterium]
MDTPLKLFAIEFFLIIQNCTMFKISISEKRSQVPLSVELDKNVILTTWGAIKISTSDFFPSSFQLKTGSLVIYIDPIEVGENADKADYILITHSHPDHLSKKDIHKLKKPETKIICSKGSVNKLGKTEAEIIVVKPEDTFSLNNFKIKAVSAYNIKNVFLWFKAHPKSKEDVGYILTVNDSFNIYHTGDTDYIPEMDKISDIDLVLIAIGGDNLTMNDKEAAQIINKIKPRKVIPMHYEIKDTEKLDKFNELIDNEIDVIKSE